MAVTVARHIYIYIHNGLVIWYSIFWFGWLNLLKDKLGKNIIIPKKIKVLKSFT